MRSLFQFVQCLCSVQIFVRGVGGGDRWGGYSTQIFFVSQGFVRLFYFLSVFCMRFVCIPFSPVMFSTHFSSFFGKFDEKLGPLFQI